MPYPRLTMMTRVRASERFTAESSSARTKASWTVRKREIALYSSSTKCTIQVLECRSLLLFRMNTVSDLLKREYLLYNFYKHMANITNELSREHNSLGMLNSSPYPTFLNLSRLTLQKVCSVEGIPPALFFPN